MQSLHYIKSFDVSNLTWKTIYNAKSTAICKVNIFDAIKVSYWLSSAKSLK